MLQVQQHQPSNISWLHSRIRRDKMPVDFATYIFASSPPDTTGYDYYNIRDCVVRSHLHPLKTIPKSASDHCLLATHQHDCLESKKNIPRNFSNELEFFKAPRTVQTIQTQTTIPMRPTSNTVVRKKSVKFADECGRRLTEVRIMKESSATPPYLRPEFLSCLRRGEVAEVRTSESTCPLQLQFKQPAADYARFKGCLNTNNVALENVRLKDYNVTGTVKVTNIGFEKTVVCRVTFNSWESHTDIIARYATSAVGQSDFDSFVFAIDVPPTFDIKRKIEFALCFKTNNQEYWDNNDGDNYQIAATPPPTPVPNFNKTGEDIFELDDKPDWSSFSSWSHLRQNIAEDRYY